MSPDRFFSKLLLTVLFGWAAILPGRSQAVGGLSATPLSDSSATSLTVTGVVLNAANGTPISRTLVSLNDRAMLTDHEGKFEFNQFASTGTAVIEVKKPGFYFNPEGGVTNRVVRATELSAPIVVRLYPEALLTGTVTSSDGLPLPHVLVSALRSTYRQSGHQWVSLAQNLTNTRGEFRLTVPPGDYRVSTNFSPRSSGSSEAVLPLLTPVPGSSGPESSIRVSSGAEERFDLHPVVTRTYMVGLRIESSGGPMFPMLLARAGDGTVFPVSTFRNRANGMDETRIALPSGTYTLMASFARGENMEYGEAAVTVPDHDISSVTMRLSSVASIPIQVLVDSGSTSDKTPPSPQQLGLQLHNVQESQLPLNSFWVMGGGSGGAYFRPVPGTYRLSAGSSGPWYVKSAVYGSNDLLQQNMTVAAAAGSSPIVITVSMQTGGLQGSTRQNGMAAPAWIDAIPAAASAVPFYSIRSDMDGSFNFSSLPPGNYQVICFQSRYSADFHDPRVLAPFTTYVRSVTVTPGNKSTVDLDAVPDAEMHL